MPRNPLLQQKLRERMLIELSNLGDLDELRDWLNTNMVKWAENDAEMARSPKPFIPTLIESITVSGRGYVNGRDWRTYIVQKDRKGADYCGYGPPSKKLLLCDLKFMNPVYKEPTIYFFRKMNIALADWVSGQISGDKQRSFMIDISQADFKYIPLMLRLQGVA